MVGTAQMRLCPPYGPIIRDPNGGTFVDELISWKVAVRHLG
jgi:hypothetical protein